ncbi:hypothetical protein SNOG_13620 [Parastagonospora nodorum SN15]|uniref:Uncharacterized protein n=1 Tax=Phaeosphaeria nodorum (strain SN15 / ATCC MYA-4574 / FGSC 10173) TaxID=321614 RepID=Q0U3P4_PHANO|nr:hypothetical protein SNOG_13620 [Parastagonospora nodorum SN15]EAT79067.1 hypothetical protein SNOG_13620 [Parastagonospora nodorum SN15]
MASTPPKSNQKAAAVLQPVHEMEGSNVYTKRQAPSQPQTSFSGQPQLPLSLQVSSSAATLQSRTTHLPAHVNSLPHSAEPDSDWVPCLISYSVAYPPPPHDSHTSPQVRTRRRSPLEEISTEICAKLVSSAETAAAPQSVDPSPTKASSATRHAVIAFSHRHFEPQAACTTAIKEDAIAAARFSRHPARPCIRPALG